MNIYESKFNILVNTLKIDLEYYSRSDNNNEMVSYIGDLLKKTSIDCCKVCNSPIEVISNPSRFYICSKCGTVGDYIEDL